MQSRQQPMSGKSGDDMSGMKDMNVGGDKDSEACDAAGGTFHPVVFNWMVRVYPFEKDQAKIWSAERQHSDAD